MQFTKHSINWFRIPVRDVTKASAFYADVLGRPLRHVDFGGRPHAVFQAVGESAVTGALGEEPEHRGGPGVTIFLDVDAVKPAVERAVKAGGKVIQPVTDLGPIGTCARIEDLDGNVVGLHTGRA